MVALGGVSPRPLAGRLRIRVVFVGDHRQHPSSLRRALSGPLGPQINEFVKSIFWTKVFCNVAESATLQNTFVQKIVFTNSLICGPKGPDSSAGKRQNCCKVAKGVMEAPGHISFFMKPFVLGLARDQAIEGALPCKPGDFRDFP